jgi:hypothetical protein
MKLKVAISGDRLTVWLPSECIRVAGFKAGDSIMISIKTKDEIYGS